MAIYHGIQLSTDSNTLFRVGDAPNILSGFEAVNIFCGPNNCGKSRLLRHIFQSIQDGNVRKFAIDGSPLFNINKLRENIRKFERSIYEQASHASRQRPFSEGIVGVDKTFFSFLCRDKSIYPDLEAILGDRGQIETMIANFRHELSGMAGRVSSQDILYIPSIRTCRPVGEEDSLFNHVKNSYFGNAGWLSRSNIPTGRELYTLIRDMLLGTPSERYQVTKLEIFLSQYFFDSVPISLSPRVNSQELYVRIYPNTERPLSHLGDGIQTLLIIFASVFLAKGQYCLLFIEEPETHLHPGLQRRLLAALSSLDVLNTQRKHQVFITTHSNHLLDIAVDATQIAVYRMSRDIATETQDIDRTVYEIDTATHIKKVDDSDLELLTSLGVQRSSVFLSNTTIWVEGPTDRLIIRTYLSAYMDSICDSPLPKLLEDRDFSFVMYGGSLLETWDFLDPEDGVRTDRLCSEAMVICDGDIRSKGDRAERLQLALGDRAIILDAKEIENTIHPKVLASFVAKHQKIQETDLSINISKDISKVKIGTWIPSLLPKSVPPLAWSGAGGALTPRWKRVLAEYVSEHVRDVNSMSSESQKLAKNIYDFVLRRSSRT